MGGARPVAGCARTKGRAADEIRDLVKLTIR